MTIENNFIDGDMFENLATELGIQYIETRNLKTVIDKEFIISHNCDGCILPEGKQIRPMMLAKPRQLDFEWVNVPLTCKKIFSQNVDVYDPRIIPIPIGLERQRWFPHLHKQDVLKQIISIKNDIIKTGLVYLNAYPNNNVVSRPPLISYMMNKYWCTTEIGKNGLNNYEQFLRRLANHKFVLCPDGNGMDTHRAWETLYVGSYPIVERHMFTEEFAKHLPILIVDNWKDVTEEFLNEKYEEFRCSRWNWDLLTKEYWKNLISKEIGNGI